MAKDKDYGAKNLRHQSDLESIQHSPGRYLGDCSTPLNAWWEIFDNSLDEHISGHASEVFIRYDRSGNEFFVADNGRGIPVDPMKVDGKKVSGIIAICVKQNLGGKFDRNDGNYEISVGTHGVGLTAANALADELHIWSYRKGWHYVKFVNGVPTTKDPVKVKKPHHKDGAFAKKGTQVLIKSSKKYFESLKVDSAIIENRAIDVAYLCPGLTVHVQIGDKKPKKVCHPGGLVEFTRDCIKSEKVSLLGEKDDLFSFSDVSKEKKTGIEVAFTWCKSDVENLYSYVNVKETSSHGVHYSGMCDAITDVLSSFAKKSAKFDPEDLRVGMVGVLHLKHKDPKFKSQTKEELIGVRDKGSNGHISKEIKKEIRDTIHPQLLKWFRKRRDLAEQIIDLAVKMKTARDNFKEKKKALSNLGSTKKFARGVDIAKYYEAPEASPDKREVFVVEGESAGGSLGESARDSSYQEVLPLKGKILNASKKELGRLLANAEVQNIVKAAGCGIGDDCDPKKSRVARILLMPDADSDGAHIGSLLLSFFANHMRPMIEAGKVYVVDSPLFRAKTADKTIYGGTKKEIRKKLGWTKKKFTSALASKKLQIEYFKGHGSAQPEDLREYAANPKTRKLLKVKVVGTKDFRVIDDIMGQSTETRRSILGIQDKVR